MNAKLDKALNRLQRILPLKARQDACGTPVKELHQSILRSFVDKGRILTREEMTRHVSDVDDAVSLLQEKDMVTFSADGTPVGAYPFTMETREHVVRANGQQVHAMCALDALAVSPMFAVDTQVDSCCRVTGEPVCVKQSGTTILNAEEAGDIHFGIIWGAESTDSCVADSLCMEMMFLRDAKTAREWLESDPNNREIFTLQEAVEFGDRFFTPLLH